MSYRVIDFKKTRWESVNYYLVEKRIFFIFKKTFWIRVDIDERKRFRAIFENGSLCEFWQNEFDPLEYFGKNVSVAKSLQLAITGFWQIAGIPDDANRKRLFWSYLNNNESKP